MPAPLDAALLDGWVAAAVAAVERHAAEIDRINVFPVADRDTGTNLLLTLRAARAAADRSAVGAAGGSGTEGAAALAGELARGAVRGARGNSGVILSQVLRGVAEAVGAAPGGPGGAVLADGLTRAAAHAAAAVARPQEGTVLTVLAAAAVAARRAAGGGTGGAAGLLDAVAVAAADAAGAALLATPAQLPELARAGVVDAGGLGLHLVLDALAVVLTGRAPAGPPVGPVPPAGPGCPGDTAGAGPDAAADGYEVMYLLDSTDDHRVGGLRAALDALGTAVAVVGDGGPDGSGTWNVHVHCADIGAALEAGLVAGRPHGVRVAPLRERAGAAPAAGVGDVERAVVAVVHGPEVAALAAATGAHVLRRDPAAPGADAAGAEEAALARALAGTGARHVVLLPGDPAVVPAAERAAARARRAGREVVVLPATSPVAGLAALAVHDPARHVGDDVVAMTEAAAATRSGALQVAATEALTWAGRCRPGDVLGLVDGEVVLIAPDVPVGALWLAARMLTAGGELVTLLLGEGVADAVGEELAAQLHRTHPEVDVVVHRGARAGHPVELGVE